MSHTAPSRDQAIVGGAEVSARPIAASLLLLAAAAVAARLLDADEGAAEAAAKVVLPTLAVGLVPGALATMVWRPRPRLTLLELIGFGAAFSFGVVHLLTVAALTLHAGAGVVLVAALVALLVMLAILLRRPAVTVVIGLDELIVAALLCALGVLLYFQGSPADTFEDEIHVAIVRRLSQLDAPSLDNFYFAPGIVYTYPFPGTHYFMALVARLGDVDALFLYHKLRFFWGPVALVLLYLASRAVFSSYAVAAAVAATAVVLLATGVFAMVPGLSWSQLAPFSHTSDVAMTVLLPAILVTGFGYLTSGIRREQIYFLASTAMLAVMLTHVHIREAVQFAAYLGCFLVMSLAVARLRGYAPRALVLLALVVAAAAVYTAWQSRVASLVGDIVGVQRAQLLAQVQGKTFGELLTTPVPSLIGGFVPYFELTWSGLTPFLLFAGPPVVFLFRHQPLVWLVASSVLAYLTVMTTPVLAVPYIYVTYFEILYTPIRNVIFFVYMFAGAFLYALTVALARVDPTKLAPLVSGAVAGIVALLATLLLDRTVAGFFVPLLAAYALTMALALAPVLTRSTASRALATAAAAVLALVTLWPDNAPVLRSEYVNVRWIAGMPDERRAALERQFGLTNGEPTPDRTDEVNVWLYRLHDLSRENVRALVTHADVVDTHRIERSTFTVPPEPPRAEHPFMGVERITWLQYPGWALLIGTVVSVWALGIVLPAVLASARGRRMAASLLPALEVPFYRYAVPFTLCLGTFAFWSARPTLSPVRAGLAGNVSPTPRSFVAQMPCVAMPRVPAPYAEDVAPDDPVMLTEQTICPPNYDVMSWVRENVPVDAVFAVNRWGQHLPSVFMPQQVVVFPRYARTLIGEDELFPTYYRFYFDRLRRYRAQPLFNDVETPRERAEFIEALGITHVLVDPPYYPTMRAVFDALPEQFALRYTRENWAVYEVVRSAQTAPGPPAAAGGMLR